jgi:uncharacterized protein YgiM (DUF1202 family)
LDRSYGNATRQVEPLRRPVAPNSANVYSAPGTNSTLVGTLAQGEILTVFEEETGWYRLLFDLPTKYRWVRKSDTELTATFHARVRSPTANVRSSPDANSADLGTLKLMDPITVMKSRDGWFRIINNRQTAWIAGWLTQGRI